MSTGWTPSDSDVTARCSRDKTPTATHQRRQGTADHGSSVQPGVKQLRSRQVVVRMARRGWRPQAANVALVVYLLCDVTGSTLGRYCLINGCCYNSIFSPTQLTCNFSSRSVSITKTGEHCRKLCSHICIFTESCGA